MKNQNKTFYFFFFFLLIRNPIWKTTCSKLPRKNSPFGSKQAVGLPSFMSQIARGYRKLHIKLLGMRQI